MKKRIILALGLAVVIGAGVFASASTLGGITNLSLGANDQVVTSCDTDGVTTAYTTRTSAGAVSPGVTANTTGVHWDVATVAVSGINAACAGSQLKIVVVNSAGTELYAPAAKTVAGSTETFALVSGTDPAVPAENVHHIAVVIAGATVA